MGWNDWNQFQSKIDDKTVREVVDAMVANGMRDAGYVYVNIDDTWEGCVMRRATSARIVSSRT